MRILTGHSNFTVPPVVPTTQASAITVTDITATTITISYTRGSGDYCIVIMKSGGAVDSGPVDGTAYIADSNFGLGTQIGSGNYVVKLGSGPVTVKLLTADTTYHFAVYEFNGGGTTTKYKASPATQNELTFTTEYSTMLAWGANNSAAPPSNIYDKKKENALISGFKTDGTWTKIDQMAFLNTYGSDAWSLINAKNPGTKNLTTVTNGGTITRTAGRGWTGDGTNSYIRTNYTPSVDGVQFTQNNAGILCYCPIYIETASSTKFLFGSGGASAAHGISLVTRAVGNVINERLNALTVLAGSNSLAEGLYNLKRTASNALALFKDGASVVSGATASTGLSAQEVYLLAYNDNGTVGSWTGSTVGFWAIGSSFDETTTASRWTTFITEVVDAVTFSDWTSYTTDLAPWLAAAATFPTVVKDAMQPTNTRGFPLAAISGSGNLFQGGTNTPLDIAYLAPSTLNIGKFNTITEALTMITITGASTTQYSGAVYHAGTNQVFFCCYGATAWMVLSCVDDSIRYFADSGIVANSDSGNYSTALKWNWIGVGDDGYLWAIPFGAGATTVARINPNTLAITYIDTTGVVGSYAVGNLTGSAKWDSAVTYGRYIYGSPSTTDKVLKVDTLNGTCSLVNTTLSISANQFGICIVAYTGFIYFWQYSGGRVMKWNPATDTYTLSDAWATPYSGLDPIGCAMVLPDGKILTGPLTGNNTYLLDPATDLITTQIQAATPYGPAGANLVGCIQAKSGWAYGIPYGTRQIIKMGYENKTVSFPENFVMSRYVIKGGY